MFLRFRKKIQALSWSFVNYLIKNVTIVDNIIPIKISFLNLIKIFFEKDKKFPFFIHSLLLENTVKVLFLPTFKNLSFLCSQISSLVYVENSSKYFVSVFLQITKLDTCHDELHLQVL